MKKYFLPALLPIAIGMLAACGGNEKAGGKDTAKGPDTTKHDSIVLTPPVPKDYISGAVIAVDSKGDTTWTLNNLNAYDTSLVDEGTSTLAFDGIPDGVGQDSFPPDWKTRSVDSKMKFMYNVSGGYNQMCADIEGVWPPETFNYPFYQRWEYTLTTDRLVEMRSMRDSVINWMKQSKRGKRWISHDLVIIGDLNAVPMLPRMLADEARLRPLIVEMKKKRLRFDAKAEAYKNDEMRTKVIQSYTQLLSAIIVVLRQEGVQPLLQAPMEKEWKKKVDAFVKSNYAGSHTQADVPLDQRAYVYFDPVYNMPTSPYEDAEIPLSLENSKFIAQCGYDYWNKTPASVKAMSAKHLSAWPVSR